MTTNSSYDEIKSELDKANKSDRNIEITYTIHSTVEFLDVLVQNTNGRLLTSIFHKPAAEPYILPYTSDHPRHVHRNIPFAALLRAARICSNVHDFNMERVRIDMSLLLNEYPPAFITEHSNRIFEKFNVMVLLQRLDADVYQELHQKLLYQPTRREQLQQANITEIGQLPVSLTTKKVWNPNIMYATYYFETGPRIAFKRKVLTWWKKYYGKPGSKVAHVQLKFATKTNRTLENFFVHKKPPREMLTMEK
jgi:hypothetical protein